MDVRRQTRRIIGGGALGEYGRELRRGDASRPIRSGIPHFKRAEEVALGELKRHSDDNTAFRLVEGLTGTAPNHAALMWAARARLAGIKVSEAEQGRAYGLSVEQLLYIKVGRGPEDH